MGKATFSSFCKAFTAHSARTPSHISRRLLRLITDCDCVKNKKGNRYSFKSKELLEFLNGEERVYKNITDALVEKVVINHIKIDFEDACYELLDDGDFDLVYDDLKKLVNSDNTLSLERKRHLLGGRDDLISNGSDIFIYAMGNDNLTNPKKERVKKALTPLEIQKRIIELINKYPKPLQIEVPTEITTEEMTYVSAILEAFAEDAGVEIILENELLSKQDYQKYKKKLDRYRADFYRAESIRESLKDTKLEKEVGIFKQLEDETYESIIDKVEEDYPTSYARMTSVLNHVTTIPLQSLIASSWVGSAEKKGVCHILVNEGKIRWKE